MCFISHLKKAGNSFNIQKICEQLGLKGKIAFKDEPKIAKYFDCDYVLLNEHQEIISVRNLESKNGLHMMAMKNHYYIVEYINYVKCKGCGELLRSNNKTYECNAKVTTFYKKQKCGKSEYVYMINCKEKNKNKHDK